MTYYGNETVGDVVLSTLMQITHKSVAISMTLGDMFIINAMIDADNAVTKSCTLDGEPETDADKVASCIMDLHEEVDKEWRRKAGLGQVQKKDTIDCPDGPRCFKEVYRSRALKGPGADQCYACRRSRDQIEAGRAEGRVLPTSRMGALQGALLGVIDQMASLSACCDCGSADIPDVERTKPPGQRRCQWCADHLARYGEGRGHA